MAYQNGSQMAIKWNALVMLGKLSGSFSGQTGSVDVTNDSSNGFKESLPTDLSGSVSFSAVYDPLSAAGYGCETLKTDFMAKTVKALVFGGILAGDHITTCQAYITKFSLNAKHGDKITCDVTFEITDTFTNGTNP